MGRLILFTGAGISAESGISTFRGSTGLWNGHDIDEVCNYLTWRRNFHAVHNFYNARRTQLREVEPNDAHLMVREWQARYETVILTQNIDDLFERAGCTDVIHLHGSLTQMECHACGHVWDIGYRAWDQENERCESDKCNCKNAIKPGVVFFNQEAQQYSKLNKIINSLTSDDVVVVIGTSGNVIPISSLLENKPGYKILNNLEPSDSMIIRMTDDSCFNEQFFEPASSAVNKIDEILRNRFL